MSRNFEKKKVCNYINDWNKITHDSIDRNKLRLKHNPRSSRNNIINKR